MSDSLLSLSAFKYWLASSPSLVVGQPYLPCDCPIANFLSSPTGANLSRPSVTATNFTYTTNGEQKVSPLPSWAIAFIDEIDDIDGWPLTGQFCLSILSNLPEVEALESTQ